MPKAALDCFGELLMTRVRDKAISQWRRVVTGQMAADEAEAKKLARLDPAAQSVFLSLVPNVVDTVLHHLLWTLEQSEDVRMLVQAGNEQIDSLADESDGLAGELYSEHGWIARFSKIEEDT